MQNLQEVVPTTVASRAVILPVSVIVPTRNEAHNLARCLESLRGAAEIFVIDSGSTDATIDIARSYGARILERPFNDFARQRNFGLDSGEFRHDWVLHLDADEIVTPEFVTELKALETEPGIDAFCRQFT